MQAPDVQQVGVLDSIKDTLRPANIADKIRANKDILLEIGLYLGIGFIIGFLFKRFSKVVAILVFGAILVLILQQMGILSVMMNWTRLYELLGMQPAAVPNGASVVSLCTEWVRVNVRAIISFVIGMLVGLKLG